MSSSCNDSGGCNAIQIIQSAAKSFFARLFYTGTGEPYNLTGATEIVALFPGSSGQPVKKTLSGDGGITVIGAAGAGKIQIDLSSVDTEAMQPNAQIAQNLQIIATIAGVAQIDTLSFGSPPIAGITYRVTLNGTAFSYLAKNTDTAEEVFNALAALISASGILISAVVSGSLDAAILTLTSTVPGLGFTDVVSAGITLVHSTPNGGIRSVFLLQQTLNIQPLDYSGD